MTFSGDHLESKSQWSKTFSRVILAAIIIAMILLLADKHSRGPALVGIALLITIMLHEAGHFIAAKWSKMKATEFFVGFGPRIWSFKKGETEYGIKALPLGGYVKIIGMSNVEEVEEEDEHRTFRKGKSTRKLIVILAGITINLLLAFLLFFMFYAVHGVAVPNATPKIDTISPSSGASQAKIQQGDIIKEIDGVKIKTFEDIREQVLSHKVGETITIKYLQDSKLKTGKAKLQSGFNTEGKKTNKPVLGVTQASDSKRLGIFDSAKESVNNMWFITIASGERIKELVSPSGISDYSQTVVKGDYERADRPQSVVGIVNDGGQFVNQDIWTLLGLIAAVNVFLAIFNLLPILPLDGGHVPIILYEKIASKIKRRDVYVDHRKLMPVIAAFFIFIALLSLSTIWLDVLKIAS